MLDFLESQYSSVKWVLYLGEAYDIERSIFLKEKILVG